MMRFLILALPVIILIVAIVIVLYSLWKICHETITVDIAEDNDTAPVLISDGNKKIIPEKLVVSNGYQIANSYELSKEELELLYYVLLMNRFKIAEPDVPLELKWYLKLIHTTGDMDLFSSVASALRYFSNDNNNAYSGMNKAYSNDKRQLWRMRNSN